MIKRILILTFLVTFFLCACSSNEKLNKTTVEENKGKISADYGAPQQEEEIKKISININSKKIEAPEGYSDLFNSQYDVVSIESDEYPELEVTLNTINSSIEKNASESMDDFERWFDMKENKPETEDYLYSSEIQAEIERADNNIVSIKYITHIEMYDSHPIYEEDAYNIDAKNGKILDIEDIVNLNDDFYDALIKSIYSDYSDVTLNEKVNLEEDIRNYFENEEAFVQKYYFKKFSFYINDTDIFFVLGGLEISDDYGGDIVATIPINSKEIKKKITI